MTSVQDENIYKYKRHVNKKCVNSALLSMQLKLGKCLKKF